MLGRASWMSARRPVTMSAHRLLSAAQKPRATPASTPTAVASTVISRKDFGLMWNTALETGGVLVGDEVTVDLDVQFVKSQA